MATPNQPAEQEKEPMLLLDTTGSMNFPTADNDSTPRKDTIKEAIGIIVAELAKDDSQAEKEAGGGGLRTVTFAGGNAYDLDDINPGNLEQQWARIHWAGGTRIMPGLNKLIEVYNEEFGARPAADRPLLMALVITDGEADDTDQFAHAVAQASGGVYFALAIIGYGPEHDAAVRQYKAIQTQNAHVTVLPFAAETDPNVIARALLRMLE